MKLHVDELTAYTDLNLGIGDDGLLLWGLVMRLALGQLQDGNLESEPATLEPCVVDTCTEYCLHYCLPGDGRLPSINGNGCEGTLRLTVIQIPNMI